MEHSIAHQQGNNQATAHKSQRRMRPRAIQPQTTHAWSPATIETRTTLWSHHINRIQFTRSSVSHTKHASMQSAILLGSVQLHFTLTHLATLCIQQIDWIQSSCISLSHHTSKNSTHHTRKYTGNHLTHQVSVAGVCLTRIALTFWPVPFLLGGVSPLVPSLRCASLVELLVSPPSLWLYLWLGLCLWLLDELVVLRPACGGPWAFSLVGRVSWQVHGASSAPLASPLEELMETRAPLVTVRL